VFLTGNTVPTVINVENFYRTKAKMDVLLFTYSTGVGLSMYVEGASAAPGESLANSLEAAGHS
jgi:hypothetical protein